MISLKNVSFGYNSDSIILNNISLNIEHGKIYSIIGRTGSGKSTLMRHFNGLLKPTSGQVLVDGEDINAKEVNLKQVRSKIGLVFQFPEQQLFAETVFDDIAFGAQNLGLPKEEVFERVYDAAKAVSLSDDMLKKSPFALSGGEKRRAAIAGVLAMKPQTLVLDEPSAGLDGAARKDLYSLINSFRAQSPDNSVVFVSHSMDEVAALADYIYVLAHGEIVLEGTPEKVFENKNLLDDLGVGLPFISELAHKLKEHSIDIGNVYTIEQAVEGILKFC